MNQGRIVKALSGFYNVDLGDRVVTCKARGRLRKSEQSPLVGDMAVIDQGMVQEILPRRNWFVRPAVANLDLLILLASEVIPVTEPFLIDRITTIAGDQNVPVAIVVITTIGWFSIDAYLIGQTTNTLFPIVPIIPVAILGGIGMTFTAMRGMKWMTWLSNIAVPLIIIFGIISMVIAVNDAGGIVGMNSIVPAKPIDYSYAVGLGVGSYAVGAVMFTPDIMRFSKSIRSAIIVMIITLMLGNTFMLLSGAIGSVVTGTPDVAIMLSMQGLLAPAFLVLVLNIWSTAQGCVYSGSMTLNSVVPKAKRTWLVIGFGVIGIIFAIIGFYNYFGDFLSATVPPLGGIFLADFLVTYKQDYPDPDKAELPTVNIAGFIAWILGFIVTRIPFGMPVVNGIIVAFVVKAVLGAIMGSGVKTRA